MSNASKPQIAPQKRAAARPLPVLHPGLSKANGDKPPPIVQSSKPEDLKSWHAALERWSRLALALPIFALIISNMPATKDLEVEFGSLTLRAVAGTKEVVTFVASLLIAKLARDACKLFSVAKIWDIGFDFSAEPAAGSFIFRDYVKPSDLFRSSKLNHKNERMPKIELLEKLRYAILLLVFAGVVLASTLALILSALEMVRSPHISPFFSTGLGLIVFALLLMAMFDGITIALMQWPATTCDASKTQWMERIRAWERNAAKLAAYPTFPEPWPPFELATLEPRKTVSMAFSAIRQSRDA